MLLTSINKAVTVEMMANNNMVRGSQLGIPKEPKTGKGGLVWKSITEMQDCDYDAIEEYFIHLTKRSSNNEDVKHG